MRVILALAAGACLLAAALLVEAPATLADQRLDAVSAGHLRIAEARGTLWNGRGELVLLPAGYRWPLTWHIDRWPLLTHGEIDATLAELPGAPDGATIVAGGERIAVRGLSFAVPAEALLRALEVPAAFATAGGTVRVQVADFASGGAIGRARLSADWRGADLPGMRPGTRIALGDVKLDLSGEGASVPGTLRNSGGDIELNGTLTWRPAGPPSIEATIKPRAGLRPEDAAVLGNALGAIGRPDGQGGYRVTWSGQ